jgi:hypothetical protein
MFRETQDDLERWFTEETCGLLLLQTHHYLTRLVGAVEAAAALGDPVDDQGEGGLDR